MKAYKRLGFDIHYRCMTCGQRYSAVFGAAMGCLLVQTVWQCRRCKADLPNEETAAKHVCISHTEQAVSIEKAYDRN